VPLVRRERRSYDETGKTEVLSLPKDPVSEQVWHDKDPSLIKGPASHQLWHDKNPYDQRPRITAVVA
jgi:hypothetical protein